MFRLRNISIKRKLMIIMMVTSMTALLLAAVAFIAYESIIFRSSASQNLLTLAEIIGSNTTAAVTFNDKKSAEEVLGALRAERHVEAACIYLPDGSIFAEYTRDSDPIALFPEKIGPDGFTFENDRLEVYQPVRLGDENIGTVFIHYDLSEVYSRMRQYAVIVLIVMVVSALVAFVLSSTLQRLISGPVLHLADTAMSVSRDKNYSVRAVKESKDELGDLIDVFNEMLAQIQQRDIQLQQAHDELEQRVADRTKELRQEIAERKKTEEQLRTREQQLSEAQQIAHLGSWEWDIHTNTVRWSDETYRIFGLLPGVFTPSYDAFLDLIHAGDRVAVERAIQISLQSLKPFSYIARIKRHDAVESIIYAEGRVVVDESGKIAKLVGICQDITERERAEDVIREQAALIDKAQDAIFVESLDHTIQYWNKSAERLYGWKTEDVLGKNSNELLAKNATDATSFAHLAVLDKSEWIGELGQVTKDGRDLVVESRWSLVHDKQGNPKSILVINTDVTEKKQLQSQFLRAQRMESLGTLAAGIAHDINNILSPILMSVDLLKRKHADDATLRILALLETNTQRGADLVKQVLAFARGMDGERVNIQMKHLVNEMDKIARETFPKSVALRTEVAKDLWVISGDATHMHQVLMNLCVNARDAISGEGTITISAENIQFDEHTARLYLDGKVGPYVLVKVTDTGSGIPKEIIEKIFDPFFTTKERGKGTGLGLSTVVAIIKSHGGFINVYSEPGKGTTFKVYLPAVLNGKASDGESTREHLPRADGELVLVIDDEVSIREITKDSLESFGYKVLTASHGKEAIPLFTEHRGRIDVVLTDMMMPFLDGPSTIKALRQIDSKVRIVAFSGLTSYGEQIETAAMGIDAFIPKPFTSERLLRTIREVLHGENAK